MSSPETDLLEGLAALLDTASIGRYVATGIYAAGDTGIVFGDFAAAPSQQIALDTYIVQDNPTLNDTTVGVQVQLRGTQDPLSVKDLSGLIFNQLQGLTDQWFGSVYLAFMWRQSGRLDGRDENNRWRSSENYYARVAWPTNNRPD